MSNLPVKIESSHEWDEWNDPKVIQSDIHAISTSINEKNRLIMKVRDGEGKEEEFGTISQNALKEISARIGFPTEFIQKLSPELQPIVINDRIKSAKKQNFTFFADEDNRIIGSSPGLREILPHREIAQITHDTLVNSGEIESVSVDFIERIEGEMNLRFMTPLETPITPRKGDILQMGLNVDNSFGTHLSVSLFTKRLVCTNGMMNAQNEYSWHSNENKTRESQIEWLQDAVIRAITQYDVLVARSARMAEMKFEGDSTAALYQRARAMKIPGRYIPLILEAFNMEPGNTEWHIVNAITRFATHSAEKSLRERLQREAGRMVESFRMATARLPHYMALQGGFQILSTEDEESDILEAELV